jgi:hypothetical protein
MTDGAFELLLKELFATVRDTGSKIDELRKDMGARLDSITNTMVSRDEFGKLETRMTIVEGEQKTVRGNALPTWFWRLIGPIAAIGAVIFAHFYK